MKRQYLVRIDANRRASEPLGYSGSRVPPHLTSKPYLNSDGVPV